MTGLAFTSVTILITRLVIAILNMVRRQKLDHYDAVSAPLVSVLIPARNEEENLTQLLGDLAGHDYDSLEILVYDDQSTDRSGEVVTDYARRDSRIRLIRGSGLPEGWLGKNHACDQLAHHARGDYFLFLDADVRVNPGMVRRTLGFMMQHRLMLLSVFPRQIMVTLGEKLVVPAMNLILLSLLPMQLIRKSHRPSLAAANGQFMLFDAANYRQKRYHAQVRNRNVEDIHIIRQIKRERLRADTVLSSGEVECRMYHGYRDAVKGLSRSVFAFFGNGPVVLLLFTLFSTFGFLFVWFGLSPFWSGIYLVVTWLLRMVVSFSSRQSMTWNAILQPLQQAAFVLTVAEAFRRRYSRNNVWKGRPINV